MEEAEGERNFKQKAHMMCQFYMQRAAYLLMKGHVCSTARCLHLLHDSCLSSTDLLKKKTPNWLPPSPDSVTCLEMCRALCLSLVKGNKQGRLSFSIFISNLVFIYSVELQICSFVRNAGKPIPWMILLSLNVVQGGRSLLACVEPTRITG